MNSAKAAVWPWRWRRSSIRRIALGMCPVARDRQGSGVSAMARSTETTQGALVCILLLVGCARPASSTGSEAVRPVKTAVVTAGEDSHTRVFPGKVESAKRVELAFQVSGLLV